MLIQQRSIKLIETDSKDYKKNLISSSCSLELSIYLRIRKSITISTYYAPFYNM